MSYLGLTFEGDWTDKEKERVRRWVVAIDRFLDAHMPSNWVFLKESDYFMATQPSLLVTPVMRDKLGSLILALKREAERAQPWVTYDTEYVRDSESRMN